MDGFFFFLFFLLFIYLFLIDLAADDGVCAHVVTDMILRDGVSVLSASSFQFRGT